MPTPTPLSTGPIACPRLGWPSPNAAPTPQFGPASASSHGIVLCHPSQLHADPVSTPLYELQSGLVLLCKSGARPSHAITSSLPPEPHAAVIPSAVFLHAHRSRTPNFYIANDTANARFRCVVRNFCIVVLFFFSSLRHSFLQHRCWAARPSTHYRL